MERLVIQEATDRIRQMEQCFDVLQKAAKEDPATICEDTCLKERLRILTWYYESGQWLQDYELDEQGLLPRSLKRGILSQDGAHDFLCQVKCRKAVRAAQQENK